MPQDTDPIYLTTKEVADLLRVRERKVYDLAAAGGIPHRRITGKLLFPTAAIHAWIEGDAAAASPRPAVLTGSHDPLLDWAVRESGCGLATLLNGSLDGLDAYTRRAAMVAGLHVPEPDGWNIQTVAGRGLHDCVLVAWASRTRGLILSEAVRHDVTSFADLRSRRVALRQPGAGAAAIFDDLMAKAGLTSRDIIASDGFARTEHDAAATVAAGDADAAIGIEAMARQFDLAFLPLLDERFDLLIDRRGYFTEPLQVLLAFALSSDLRTRADAMDGYDLAGLGQVRWLSP